MRSNAGRARAASDKRVKFVKAENTVGRLRIDRGMKKSARHASRLQIDAELLDMELQAHDPEVWLYKMDLVTFADPRPKSQYMSRDYTRRVDHFDSVYDDPYEYQPDDYDWDVNEYGYDEDLYRNRYDDLNAGWDDDVYDDREPDCTEPAWRDLWVDGRVSDEEYNDRSYASWYDDSWYDDSDGDYADPFDWENPLLKQQEVSQRSNLDADPVLEDQLERARAGERYYKTYKRTVLKPLKAA